MTFFDKREIIDSIRHDIRIEDETGIASRVIRPPAKRSKYGGLPLNFRITLSDDEEEDLDDFYTIPLYEETSGTRELIATRLRSRTDHNENQKKRRIVETSRKLSAELFIPRPIQPLRDAEVSIISKNIERGLKELQSPLNEYAVFQAQESAQSKKIMILYTNDEKEVICRIPISVLQSARVFQLINLCHYKYFQATGKELPGKLGDYELFMAEEDEEIDTDFPEIDRSRLLSELDFACLALVRKDVEEETDSSSRSITIYIPKGPSYTIHVPNQDFPFSWIIDEVLRRREEQGENDLSIVQTKEYSLEPVDTFDHTMELSKPISSTACNEFVMIRKNSSRAGYHPHPERLPPPERPQVLDRMQSVISPGMPMTPGPRSSGIFEFPEFPRSPDDENVDKEMVACFQLERLHKLKPKWTANLLFYWDKLEVSPFASESERRKSFLPQQYQKIVKVAWEQLVDVQTSEKEKKSKEIVPLITITWLPFLVGLERKTEMSLSSLAMDYVGMNWKSIQFECKSREDASEIRNLLMHQMRGSAAQQAWNHSQNGHHRPSSAAELALFSLQMDSTSTGGGSSKKKSSRFKTFARLSRILIKSERRTSSVVSSSSGPAVPLNGHSPRDPLCLS